MIYLDNAATSFPKPEAVYTAMDAFARTSAGNPGRSGHDLAVRSELLLDETRRLLARLFGSRRPERIVFTANATDALNMAIKGSLRPGAHVITSVLEHNSVLRPIRRLEHEGVVTVTRLPATAEHVIDPDALRRALTPATSLIALTHVSNVTGTIQPIADFGRIAREHGALLLIDASQSAGVVPIDLATCEVDLLAFTGHKGLLGPTGTGGLVVGERAQVGPWREGGTGGDGASELHPSELPYGLEAGTPNVMGIAGLREGVKHLLERGVTSVLDHERELLTALFASLVRPERFRWYGSAPGTRPAGVGLVSLECPDMGPADAATILDQRFQIAVRAGLHCAPLAHGHLGTLPEGTLRVSVGVANTREEMVEAAAALDALVEG